MSDAVVGLIDHVLVESRIRDLAHYALGDRSQRMARIVATLSKLTSGWYLVGLGPHFGDIVRVGENPIMFGRPASLLEEPASEVIDYAVNDATLMGPREVSRVHMSVRHDPGEGSLLIRDEHSSTGVWIGHDGSAIPPGDWVDVEAGTLLSLGPSRTNALYCLLIGEG
ncbi:MAG: FHA domain-containing protein [Phycisphaerales bacterium]|nr:FHA domain-containing protein [Phycisphaerales bacterium]